MTQAITLARPYARAAFAVARDEDGLAVWSQALTFSARIAADTRVAELLGNPQLAQSQAQALLAPEAASASFLRFLALLAQARRLPLLAEIAALYEQLRAEAERVVKATVTSAGELAEDELAKIVAALKQRFGREVVVTTAVDPSLIGGAVIAAGEVVIDGSLKGKLARLQSSLTH